MRFSLLTLGDNYERNDSLPYLLSELLTVIFIVILHPRLWVAQASLIAPFRQ